jgi:hypothetical protein
LIWGALCDERTGLSFITAANPRQRSHSRVRVPRDWLPYFTVSDSRLPQPGGPGPRIYIPQQQVPQLYAQVLSFLFVAPYDPQGCGGGIGTRLHAGVLTGLCFDSPDRTSAWTQRKHRSSVDVGDVVSRVRFRLEPHHVATPLPTALLLLRDATTVAVTICLPSYCSETAVTIPAFSGHATISYLHSVHPVVCHKHG